MTKIEIVSDAEAETADFVICVRKDSPEERALPDWIKADNCEGTCSRCGAAVISGLTCR